MMTPEHRDLAVKIAFDAGLMLLLFTLGLYLGSR